MMHVLALDPGGTTGWSQWEIRGDSPIKSVRHGQILGGVRGFVEWWLDVLPGYGIIDQVVSESFILDGRTAAPDVTPLRIEGALEVLWGDGIAYQRNTLKRLAPNDLVKRAGFWWAGEPHATDSARHAIAWTLLNDHRPTTEWLYPPPIN